MSKPTDVDLTILRKVVGDNLDKLIGDGHMIFKPSKYDWLPKWVVVECTHIYYSNYSDPKETIYSPETGKEIDKCEGIYNLTMLCTLAGYLNADYKSMFGRGSQARAIVKGINNLFNESPDTEVSHG